MSKPPEDMTCENVDGKGTDAIIAATEGVWEHPCGCQLFHLNDDGTVSCAYCLELLIGLHWARVRTQ